MSWDCELNLVLVRGGHPEREPAVVDEVQCCKVQDIVEHSLKTIRSLGWDVLVLSGIISTRVTRDLNDSLQMRRFSLNKYRLLTTPISRPQNLQPLPYTIRRITNNPT